MSIWQYVFPPFRSKRKKYRLPRFRFVPVMPVIFVGPFGSGKSYAMMEEALRDPHKRVYVHESMKVTLPPGYEVIIIKDWSELIHAKRGTALIDEAAVFFSSRDRADIDGKVRASLKQARKRKLRVIYGEQHFKSLKSEMRQYFDKVVLCRRVLIPMPGPTFRERSICCDVCNLPAEDRRRDFPLTRTWFVRKVFNSEILEEATSVHGPASREDQKKMGKRNILVPKKVTFHPFLEEVASCYDTDSFIEQKEDLVDTSVDDKMIGENNS